MALFVNGEQVSGGGPPSGNAGGVLAGTYPDPSLNAGNAAGNAVLKGTFTAAGSLLTSTAANVPSELALGTNGYMLRSVSGVPTWREIFGTGLLSDRPVASARREGQWYWSTDAAAGSEVSVCMHEGDAVYAWETVPYGSVQPTPLLLTSANATVTDATPAADGSAAITSGGVITLSTDNALPSGFAAGPKISLPFSDDAGSRFRARVRLVSKAGPSSDTLVALYCGGGLSIYARISGQIGIWDLGGVVPVTSPLTAQWDGTNYLEIRVTDALIEYAVWQGSVYTPVYNAMRTDLVPLIGVVMASTPAGATQTTVLDQFEVTDLRAW